MPKAVGSATITVTGAGGTNYNSIDKTYAATVKVGESYVYWFAASGSETSKIRYSDAVGTASTIVRGATPASVCNSSVTSDYKFCAMFRDVYNSSNVYQYREGCIYEMATTKMICFKPEDFQPMSQASDMIGTSSAVKEKIRTGLNSTFGLSLGNTDCNSIYAYGGVNYITASCTYRPTSGSAANYFRITMYVGSPFNSSTSHVTPEISVHSCDSSGNKCIYCDAYTGMNYDRLTYNNYCKRG